MNCDECLILERIKELSSLNISSLEKNEEGEYFATICETEWIRILLIRTVSNPSIFTIDVEVALPNAEIAKNVKKLLIGMKTHIDYVVKLQDHGFSLEMLGREFLCSAMKELTEDEVMDSTLSAILVPPLF